MQERSFTVPQMESLPMLPPANSQGETMKPSVVKAVFPGASSRIAASSAVNSGFLKCFAKILAMRSAVCLPPAPCARVIVSVIRIHLHSGKKQNKRPHSRPCRRRQDARGYRSSCRAGNRAARHHRAECRRIDRLDLGVLRLQVC